MDLLFSDPIARWFALLITGLLAAGLLILGTLRLVFKKRLSAVWTIYRSWLIMAPVTVICISAGRTAVITGVILLSLFGFREFSRGTGLNKRPIMTIPVYLGILALGVFCFLEDPRLHVPGWYGLFMAMPVYVVGLILLVPVLQNAPKGQLQACTLAITGFVYFGWMFGHLAFLANSPHAVGYLFYLVVAVEINDISAFVFGKLFGKHKLRAGISPNKTVEGSLGALAVSMTLPFLLSFALPGFETPHLILTGLIVGIGGQIGDLTISFIKRDVGIKDMGRAIPGHGGILDRLDSMIYVAPFFFHMVRWYFGVNEAAA